MKSGGGKSKGSGFERELCTLLSRWISHDKDEDLLWRSAMSGGRATVAKKKGRDVRQTGDICAVSPDGHLLTDKYFIEAKFYRKLHIDTFLIEQEGPLAKFWDQTCKQAYSHGLMPMLIAKENRKPPIVVTHSGHLDTICRPPISFTLDPEIRLLSEILKTKFVVSYKPRRKGMERIRMSTRVKEQGDD